MALSTVRALILGVFFFGFVESHGKQGRGPHGVDDEGSLRTMIAGHDRHKHKRQDEASGDQASYVDIAHVEVFLDEHGQPVSTTTSYGRHSTGDNIQHSTVQVPAVSSDAIVSEASESKSSPSDGIKDTSGQSSANGHQVASGVTYSPYNADHSCKSASQVANDLANLDDFNVVRLYGTDCNQVANVLKAIGPKVSIFAGIFQIGDISSEVSTLATAVDRKWNKIAAVIVGNELVNSGSASVQQVTSAVGAARSALRKQGYKGPVAAADTMIAIQAHPQLCQASDFCAVNCHAFFDGHVLPSDAGTFVANWAQRISKLAGGKRVVVTESGWPTKGSPNQEAVPGASEHQQAIQSLKSSFSKDLILYNLYNDLWKQDSSDTFHAEKWWGLKGSTA